MNPVPVLILLAGIVASLGTYELSRTAFVDTQVQQAQVYSSLQGAVKAFLGLGSSSSTQSTQGGSYTSTTSNTQTYSSFDGADSSFAGTEAQYAQNNGFPDQNYTGTFADDGTGSIRQTGAGIQTTDTTGANYGAANTVNQITNNVANANNTSTTAPNSVSIAGTNPVLSCIPGTVAAGEPALVFYACGDTSTSTTATGFETAGAVSGKDIVYPSTNETLEVTCSEGTSAQCLVEVITPSVAIIATPSSTVRNGTVDISWRGDDVNDCAVRSNKHTAFSRRGITGDVQSPSLAQTTTFTVYCETEVGTVVTKSVEVTVN